ncbi:MAG: RidA family protein [Ignavibacteria bacterium]|nr:RidA family protein [Ignavibacteria bacterium]
MKTIVSDKAPKPGGHYAQAIVHGGLVYVSGQLPIDAATGEKKLGTIEEQTELTLRNLEAVLLAANSGLHRVLKTTVYISDIELWGRVNTVYARIFGDHKPARAVVPTKDLHYGFLIEIEAVAATSD